MKDYFSNFPNFSYFSRRRFLKVTATGLLGTSSLFEAQIYGDTKASPHIREARYYDKLDDKKIICKLCPNECRVADMERGTCGVRENNGGKYYTLVYGNPCSAGIDPIEKKPLFHYYPGSSAFSIATAGCNFSCKFCQNWEISQKRPEQVKSIKLFPSTVVDVALQKGCKSIAHTYTEPVVFFEYLLDCAIEGKRRGIPSVMISNGFIREKPMRELCKYLGAIKIDLKAFTDKFYREICGGEIKPVLRTLQVLREERMWFEIVVLLIPSLNDGKEELNSMTRWIAKELGTGVPVHFSRYYPTYMLKNLPPTSPETLQNARKIAMNNGLKFVYVGNILSDSENTYCPSCGKVIIERMQFQANTGGMLKNRCKYCKTVIPGIF